MAGDAKVKSKDLSYDTTLPPFLQRLRAQHAGQGDPDRHERPIARPRRTRDHDDDDDAPTVVDASGEMVTKEQFEQLNKSDGDAASASATTAPDVDADAECSSKPAAARASAKLTEGAATKKRKVAKVIGNGEHAVDVADPDSHGREKDAKKPKKKAKPIKLAFDDD